MPAETGRSKKNACNSSIIVVELLWCPGLGCDIFTLYLAEEGKYFQNINFIAINCGKIQHLQESKQRAISVTGS
jgi:hypothetical protein